MNKRTVLLADDDPGLRRLVGVTLGSEHFNLLVAGDGEETLSVARQRLPALILLDINMPRRNGLEVCRLLKADPSTSHIKIVMLTASGSDVDRTRALEASADDYFIKPFSPIALLDKVYALLGGPGPRAALPMDSLLSPLGLGLALLWSFAVLASVQLTVRLIMAFSVRRTAIAAVVLTVITVPISVVYLLVFGRSLTAMPLAMLVTAVVGYVIADRVL